MEYIGIDGSRFVIKDKIYVIFRGQSYYLLEEEYRDTESFDFMCWLIETKRVNSMTSLRRRIRGRFYIERTNRVIA